MMGKLVAGRKAFPCGSEPAIPGSPSGISEAENHPEKNTNVLQHMMDTLRKNCPS